MGEIELHREPAALALVVGGTGITAPVRDTRGHAHRLVLHMASAGETGVRGREGPGEQRPLGVCRTVARMAPEDVVDGVDGLLGQGAHAGTLKLPE
jgi:hypothetical protein